MLTIWLAACRHPDSDADSDSTGPAGWSSTALWREPLAAVAADGDGAVAVAADGVVVAYDGAAVHEGGSSNLERVVDAAVGPDGRQWALTYTGLASRDAGAWVEQSFPDDLGHPAAMLRRLRTRGRELARDLGR
jgi:hypothetical protein